MLAEHGPETSYTEFLDTLRDAERPPVLVVGANDGMLHALRGDNGAKLFAYMPQGAFEQIAALTEPDRVSKGDGHRYYVDGSPFAMDAFIEVSPKVYGWRTVLVGATGAGGRTVFALDVTDPLHFSSDNVLREFSHPQLGVTLGRPTIARLPSGWVALFANGYNSEQAQARLFVVDLGTGRLIREFNTGVGSSSAPNGLATPCRWTWTATASPTTSTPATCSATCGASMSTRTIPTPGPSPSALSPCLPRASRTTTALQRPSPSPSDRWWRHTPMAV